MRSPDKTRLPAESRTRDTLLPGLLLLLLTVVLFGKVIGHDFVNYDDQEYLTENPHVRSGLTVQGVVWAFSSGHAGNWHPVTWMSHMLDISLFGMDPGAHHAVSLLYHASSVLILFLALSRMTGRIWPSALVACLFAVHPIQVESVAWAAERKNVLSTLFWMLTVLFYARYARQRTASRYFLVIAMFALSLMSKPMGVTIPFTLLLLDYWPLDRLKLHERRRPKSKPAVAPTSREILPLVREKIPLFALSLAASVVTYAVQKREGAVLGLGEFSIPTRLSNAAVSCVEYIGSLVWPAGLSVFYPYREDMPRVGVLLAVLTIVVLSILAVRLAPRRPYVVVGWLWYVGTLVPVIGIVQVGIQARADRYAYVPMIGLCLVAAWGTPELLGRFKRKRLFLTAISVLIIGSCAAVTYRQLARWKNTEALFGSAVRVDPGNYLAHNALGSELASQGRYEEAIRHYAEALRLKPLYADANNNLGVALIKTRRPEEAVRFLQRVLETDPANQEALLNLGTAMLNLGRYGDALERYRQVLNQNPDSDKALVGEGIALSMAGRLEEAVASLTGAVRVNPESGDAWYNLGKAHLQMGRLEDAVRCFAESLRVSEGDPQARYNMAMAIAYQGKLDEAAHHFRRVLQIRPDFAEAHNNLAAILASQGKYDEAATHYEAALRIRPDFHEAREGLEAARDAGARIRRR